MRRRTVLVVAILVTSLGFALGRLTAVADTTTALSQGVTDGAKVFLWNALGPDDP